MHHRAEIVRYAVGDDLLPRALEEVANKGVDDVRRLEDDAAIGVRTRLFVPEAQSVSDFVLYRSRLNFMFSSMIDNDQNRYYDYSLATVSDRNSLSSADSSDH